MVRAGTSLVLLQLFSVFAPGGGEDCVCSPVAYVPLSFFVSGQLYTNQQGCVAPSSRTAANGIQPLLSYRLNHQAIIENNKAL